MHLLLQLMIRHSKKYHRPRTSSRYRKQPGGTRCASSCLSWYEGWLILSTSLRRRQTGWRCQSCAPGLGRRWCSMVTWLHLRTHHLWRTMKEVGLLSEDRLPQSMTQPVQLLNQTIHLHPSTSHFAHYTISAIEGVATPALPFSTCFCPPSSPSHIPLIPPFPPFLSYPPTQRLCPPYWRGPVSRLIGRSFVYLFLSCFPGLMQSLDCMPL